MKKFHTLKFLNLVFMFLLCSQVYSVSPESTEFKGSKKVIKVIFDLSPGEVRYEYKNNKRIEKPVFEYNPRADIIKSLKGAGFRLTRESNQKYDLALVIVYDEKQVLSSSGIPISSTASFDFALQDEDGKIVLKESLEQRIAPSQVKNFIIKELSEMIRGRLQATDEVSFLISQLKQGRSLGRPIKRNLVKSNIPHLKRLRELNDARTIEVFVSFLRSYNPNQRLIARSALLDLDYTPPKGTKDEVAFEMVSVINGRRKLHNIIMTYGSPAIEMIIEDVKCQYTRCGGRWYGGGQITEVNPDLVLKSLTEEKMSPFLQRTIRNKQGRFVKEKRKWKQEWNDTAVTKLIEVISTEHEELYGDEQNSFCDFAIDVLGEIADKRAIEPLKRYLAAHPESTTAKEAIEKIGDPQAVEQLITALNDKEKDAREKAALVLGKIGDPRAVEPLITALNDKDRSVRMHAARALGKIDDSRAVEPLIAALKNDSSERVRECAAKALGKIDAPRAVEPLIAALKHDSSDRVRECAAEVLGKIDVPRAVEPLIAVLRGGRYSNYRVKEKVEEVLERIKDRQGAEPFVPVLKNKNPRIREYALEALDKMGWSPENDNQKVIYLIAKGQWDECVKIGKTAVEPLIAALKIDDENLRKKIDDENPRVKVALVLGKIGDPRAVEPLIAALNDEDMLVQWNAIEALGKIGDSRAVEALIAVLKDKDKIMRRRASRALGKIDYSQAVEQLITALNDKEKDAREKAALVLGKIGDPRAVEPLIAALNDKDRSVRMHAAGALGKITGKDFGENHKKWQRWWKRNKKKFLKK